MHVRSAKTPDMQPTLTTQAIARLAIVRSANDLASLIDNALSVTNLSLRDGDLVVVAHPIASLSE